MKLQWNRLLILTLLKSIFYCAILFVGLGIGFTFNDWPNISFKKEISLDKLFDVGLAVFVAVWVPFYINKKITKKSIEKDLLVEACRKHEEREVGELESMIEKVYPKKRRMVISEANDIISKTKRVSNRLSLLVDDVFHYSKDDRLREVIETLKNDQIQLGLITEDLRNSHPKITSESYTKSIRDISVYLKHMSELRMLINDV